MEVKVTTKPLRCPACRSTAMEQIEYQREFYPRGKRVVVDLLALRCQSCGAESVRAAQHDENLKRLKARKAQYDGLLLGEEIFSLRRRYGITQQAAAKIFGKGKIAFSRYENETSYPDESTTLLLTLAIEKPDVIRALADKANVELPLWDARCEEERAAKTRMFRGVLKVKTGGHHGESAMKRAVWSSTSNTGSHREASFAFDHSAPIGSANDDRYTMGVAAA